MRTPWLLLVGVVGWAASGVDWSREAVGQEAPAPTAGAERSIRRERDGVLRRRGLLPPRETAAPTSGTDAPPYDSNSSAEPRPYVPPGFDSPQGPSLGMEGLGAPMVEPTSGAAPAAGLLGRFQVSAYGSPNGHGCYIVDTMTGRTWHVANGQPPQVVAETLSPYAPQPTMPVHQPAYGPPSQLYPRNERPVPQPKLAEPMPDAAS